MSLIPQPRQFAIQIDICYGDQPHGGHPMCMSLGRFLHAATRPQHVRLQSLRCYASMSSTTDVAIVGGGVAGLSCAVHLAAKGLRATVFDMGTRQAGGKCCSRDMAEQQLSFDHGCQVLAPRSKEFQAELDSWVGAGVAQQWSGKFGVLESAAGTFQPWAQPDSTRQQPAADSGRSSNAGGFFSSLMQQGRLYTGVPSMQAVCGHMARTLEGSGKGQVVLSCKVVGADWDEQQQRWSLQGNRRGRAAAGASGEASGSQQQQQPEQLGTFKALVVADSLAAMPDSAGYAGVTAPNAPAVAEALQRIAGVTLDPVFTLMVAFEQPLEAAGPCEGGGCAPAPALAGVPFDAAAVTGGTLQWVACNSSKPGRPQGGPQCWVALSTPAFARQLMQQFPLHVGGQYNPQTQQYLQGVAPLLYAEFEKLLAPFNFGAGQAGLPKPTYLHAQRWGRGFVQQPLGVRCLAAPQQRFAAAGDFCLGSTVEDAWLSGQAAADEVAAMLL